MGEIRGFLDRHATTVSIDMRQTQYLETLRKDLSSFISLMATWDTVEGDVVDESAFEEMSGWVTCNIRLFLIRVLSLDSPNDQILFKHLPGNIRVS